MNNFEVSSGTSAPRHELMSPTTPTMPENATANLFAPPADVEMTNGDHTELMNGLSSKVSDKCIVKMIWYFVCDCFLHVLD